MIRVRSILQTGEGSRPKLTYPCCSGMLPKPPSYSSTVFCSRSKNSTGADSSQNVRVMQILGGVQIYQLEVNTIEGRGGSPILSLWEAFGAPSPFKHLAQSTPAFCTSFLLNCFLYTNVVIFKHGSTETEAALENTSQLYNIHSSRRPMHNYTCNSGHHSPKNIYIILNIRNMPL